MNVLFVHQNFPGQFKHLAPALVARGDRVAAMCINDPPALPGMIVKQTRLSFTNGSEHPWVRNIESKVIRGEASFQTARGLRDEGFDPDVIVAHPAWGESLFLKEVWPAARLGIFCEYYYHAEGGDIGFDPEFSRPDVEAERCRVSIKNLAYHLQLELADGATAPTRYQASTFPEPWRDRITIVHDGIDMDALKPRAGARVRMGSGISLSRDDEVITFVSRNLEPARGYHIFMRALPELMRRRPKARVVIVGGAGSSYGPEPVEGRWRDIFLGEVRDRIDMSRVHFLGSIPYPHYVALMQVSSVHLYLTYPFVLSWSLIEAMAMECAIVASDTAPVREAVIHGETGRLFPFFDKEALVGEVCALLEHPEERRRLGRDARSFARDRYDLRSHCLPRQLEWVDSLRDPVPPA